MLEVLYAPLRMVAERLVWLLPNPLRLGGALSFSICVYGHVFPSDFAHIVGPGHALSCPCVRALAVARARTKSGLVL